MKAIHFDAPGNPEVMRIVDVEKPVPGENQVLIKVKAAGVNRPDLIQREGNYPPPNGHSNILGLEVSGEIKSKGRNVKNFKVGDPVCALVNGGGYAEFCVADAGNIINKPKNLSLYEFKEKLVKIFIHGFLHLLNFDHIRKKDYLKMLKEEQKLFESVHKFIKLN